METKTIQNFLSSYSWKMVVVTGLAIVLLIPSFLIQDIIRERIALSEKVKNELYAQWGGRQVIAGPVLNVPYSLPEPGLVNAGAAIYGTGTPDAGNTGTGTPGTSSPGLYERQGVAHFLPEFLITKGVLFPETRKRGIYKVVVYEGRVNIKATFAPPDVSRLELQNARYNWDAAYFTIGISDMRGLKNLPEPIINGQKIVVEPGVADTDLFQSGLTVKTGPAQKTGALDPAKPIQFDVELVLNGSENLSVEVPGKKSEVFMASDWPSPGFTGGFLPNDRSVTSEGFNASWQVTHLNRNFPQQWVDGKFNTRDAVLGVDLLIPVDHYQKSMRSVKYAILFIALNFIAFIFMEIKSKTRIHPFQYTLVAFALLMFYTLLISLGEQIGFNLAYLVSAVAVTALISWYAAGILKERRNAILVTLLQTGLYLFLFAILQLQDYAMLAGSIGLFLILAIIMWGSRQVKWYPEE
jgi:inner membrane protein